MGGYPRPLRKKELDLLLSVLPGDRPGYRPLREFVSAAIVLGEGRRGAGNLILGRTPASPDHSTSLSPVIAAGAVETTRGPLRITVREHVRDQMDVEILSARGEEIPDHFEEKRCWSYASWLPGLPSPETGVPVRTVAVAGGHTLGVCAPEHRVWVYDGTTGIVHPVPITNFHNALMLHRGIRDPRIALESSLFFETTGDYSDADLEAAFLAYNTSRPRVAVPPDTPGKRSVRAGFFRRLIRGGKGHG